MARVELNLPTLCVCVCVCVRKRERERERGTEGGRESVKEGERVFVCVTYLIQYIAHALMLIKSGIDVPLRNLSGLRGHFTN